MTLREKLTHLQKTRRADLWVAINADYAEYDSNNTGFFLSEAQPYIDDANYKLLDAELTKTYNYVKGGTRCVALCFGIEAIPIVFREREEGTR